MRPNPSALVLSLLVTTVGAFLAPFSFFGWALLGIGGIGLFLCILDAVPADGPPAPSAPPRQPPASCAPRHALALRPPLADRLEDLRQLRDAGLISLREERERRRAILQEV